MKKLILIPLFLVLFVSFVNADLNFGNCKHCCGHFLINHLFEKNNIYKPQSYFFENLGDKITYKHQLRELLEENNIETTGIGDGINFFRAKRHLSKGNYIVGLKYNHWWLITGIIYQEHETLYEVYDLINGYSYFDVNNFKTSENFVIKIN